MNNILTFPAFSVVQFLGVTLLMAGLFKVAPVSANGNIESFSDILSAPGNAGLGILTGTELSPYRGVGSRFDMLPLYLYEGEQIFLHSNRVGVKLFNSSDQRLDLLLERRLEGFPAKSNPTSLEGMVMRNSGTDLGLSYRYQQPWGTLQAELLHEVGSTSKGSELRLGYTHEWRSGPWTLRPSLTLALRDAKLNNYYYGVLPGEATPDRPAYAPGAGINTSLGLYGSYDLSPQWRLLAGMSATLLDSQAKNSPIVQKSVLPGIYVGAAYDFVGHEPKLAKENSPIYFKAFYGKATEDGCSLLRIVTAQCLSTASNNPTSITGIQIGKPFIENLEGRPLNLVGYVGLAHHDDRGLQPNGLRLDVFMKGFYFGFPWSHLVKTRLGLGVGVSLVQRVPYIEASSQTANGRPASRLLTYLDPTLDVSLGDLLSSRALKKTYLGVGISHRSGIYGSSRLLGNVNKGGSNYIYFYVESVF